MKSHYTVIVIGGGTTGTAIARDLVLRGVTDVLLLEKRDLAAATTGKCHANLHSGMRYILNDLPAALECLRENEILKRIAPHTVDPAGSLWIAVDDEMVEYAYRAREVADRIGLPITEVDPQEAMREEPLLTRRVLLAYRVPDAGFDPFRLAVSQAMDARRNGATIRTHHRVVGLDVAGGRVQGVQVVDETTGQRHTVGADLVINAAGPWGGQVARMAGIEIPVTPNKGTLAVYNLRLTVPVVALLRPPSDGDGLVAMGYQSTAILGTTSVDVEDPEDAPPTLEEVARMEDNIALAVPAIRRARILRLFAGVRPLYSVAGERGRQISRSTTVLDHEVEHGVAGFITVAGGKYATARLMGEMVTDLACRKLGVHTPCVTHLRELPGAETRAQVVQEARSLARRFFLPHYATHKLAARYGALARELLERDATPPYVLCSCVQMTSAEIKHAVTEEAAWDLDDVRRRTRLGMGTCQGTFCTYKAAAILAQVQDLAPTLAHRRAADFLQERWKGLRFAVQKGNSLAQARLMHAFYVGTGGYGGWLDG